MDAAAFEQVYGSFRDFHAYFAPLFGRRETREHSGHYLQALLVQSGERRNAENLSETVPGSARGMQRFLTDSPWDDEVIIGRLQEYLGTRLEHPEGVWVLDGSEPRYYLSNAPEDTPLETLAYVGGSRWRIETEFETEKSDVGLDEYETRTWAGWHHHVALCLLGEAFLLSLQQAWGEKDAPDHEAAGLPGGAGNAAPGTVRANRVAAVA